MLMQRQMLVLKALDQLSARTSQIETILDIGIDKGPHCPSPTIARGADELSSPRNFSQRLLSALWFQKIRDDKRMAKLLSVNKLEKVTFFLPTLSVPNLPNPRSFQ